ncbi:dihydrofolate reductase family protein [Nocardia sp. NPDC050710]|uniref:dihydrofolate reductase family protein n=1 Tax=Nocardia sp. NPDC050710 TaxID=3157220 RepID=UPI0033CC69D1
MGKIIHIVHQSLDGYIEGPNGEFDWPVMDSEMSEETNALAENADAFLYGRVVWEMMSYFWPRAEELSTHPHDLAFAPIWRAKPKLVVSRTLPAADWNATVVSDPDNLAELKRDRTLLLFGGSELASELTRRGLIDEYLVYVHPVLLGGGKPVFSDVKLRAALRLVESRVYGGQVVLLRHERTAEA